MQDVTPYPYKLLNKYPGMRIRDEVIWDEYVKRHRDAFIKVWYNVPLGDPFPNEMDAAIAKANGGFEVSQWRIDVLAEDEDSFAVIEVKPEADSRAIGEALCYAELLKKEWNLAKPVIPIVLTNRISPIMEQVAKMMNVIVIVP